MNVLGRMVKAVRPGGLVLDLEVVAVNPVVESGERVLCEIDAAAFFRKARAASAAVRDLVVAGRLVEETADDHDVLSHFLTGAELVDHFAGKERQLPADVVPGLRALTLPCIVRERCRLSRLRVR